MVLDFIGFQFENPLKSSGSLRKQLLKVGAAVIGVAVLRRG